MSLLKTIKGTFKNVQEDISGSLKSLTISPEKPKVPEGYHHVASMVNYDAGADILHRNEIIWKHQYQFTEETSKRAQDVDIQIGNMYIYYDKQSEILMKIHDEASRLPTLIAQLQDITDSLALVEEEYDKLEAALVHLENLCEEQEFQKNVASHHKQLAVYKMKKEHELQRYKVQLAREHAQKVEQVNKKRQHLLHEKQAAFDEQFTQDVDYFKKHGKPGRSPSNPESEKKLDLAEIEIDEDPEALDAFLESSDAPLTDAKDNSEAEVSEVLTDNEGSSVEVIPEITSPSETEVTPEIISPDETETTNQSSSDTELSLRVTSPDEEETENQSSAQTDSVAITESDNNRHEIDTENHSSLPKDTETDENYYYYYYY